MKSWKLKNNSLSTPSLGVYYVTELLFNDYMSMIMNVKMRRQTNNVTITKKVFPDSRKRGRKT